MRHLAGLMLGLSVIALSAYAQNDNRLGAQFDRPVAVRKVPPKPAADSPGEIVCTYYGDLVVRESGTDSPAPNDAVLSPLAQGQPRPPCDARHADGGIALTTEGFSFIGRKGQFLLFSATDPNGAVPFMVIDATTGRVVFEDGTAADRGIQTVALDHGALRLRYRRGVNASCSIMQDAGACWSKLVADGKIPAAMAQSVPSPNVCAAAYKADKAPADDPSVITYDVEATIEIGGRAQVQQRGAVGCLPLP
jgi:hypothetical protein